MKLLISLTRSLASLPSRISAAPAVRAPFPKTQIRTMTTTGIPGDTRRDQCTLSNYDCWRTKHTIADLFIDFKNQKLDGTVTLQLESLTEKESKSIILDTSFLEVTSINVNGQLA